ncbi:hypothetical protein, partial [Herbaspirillum sp.]|uniref:hypothetical protein n=1 Tax=Herbaspirillum sp. TaxID=1890675 RepID=UPI00339046C4
MSKLDEKARAWACGRLMTDSLTFPSYAIFKREVMLTFQPPQCEFRMRNRFLDISQGKRDLHTYVQEVRYLLANIVDHPVDESTQIAVFMKGLNPGSLKTQMYRKNPTSLDQAISEGLKEEFSVKQSKEYGSFTTTRANSRRNNTSSYRFPDSRERQYTPSCNRPKAHPPGYCEPEPMDCSYAEQRPRPSKSPTARLDKSKLRCRRCQ